MLDQETWTRISEHLIGMLISWGGFGAVILFILLGIKLFPKLFGSLFIVFGNHIKYAMNGHSNPEASTGNQKDESTKDEHIRLLISNQQISCNSSFSKKIEESRDKIIEKVDSVHRRIDDIIK